jgi:hypothetical protein
VLDLEASRILGANTGNFNAGKHKLVDDKRVTENERKQIDAFFDAASAAMHRSHEPEVNKVNAMIDISERMVNAEVLVKNFKTLEDAIPKRPVLQKLFTRHRKKRLMQPTNQTMKFPHCALQISFSRLSACILSTCKMGILIITASTTKRITLSLVGMERSLRMTGFFVKRAGLSMKCGFENITSLVIGPAYLVGLVPSKETKND